MTAQLDYFAVPDSCDPTRMRYWFRSRRGSRRLRGWPPRSTVCLSELHAAEAAIAADPQGAALRFATLTFRCCCCGKRLTNARSKCYGIGPVCRQGLPPGFLVRLLDAVGLAHAAALAGAGQRGGWEGKGE